MKINNLYQKDEKTVNDIREFLQLKKQVVVEQKQLLSLSGKTGYMVAVIYSDYFGRNLLVNSFGAMPLPVDSTDADIFDGIDGRMVPSGLYDFNEPMQNEGFINTIFDCIIKYELGFIEQMEDGVDLYEDLCGSLILSVKMNKFDLEEWEAEKKNAKRYHIDMYNFEKWT